MADDTEPVRAADQLDWPTLEAYLRDVLALPPGRLTARQFSAGRANLTYLVTIGGTRLVVRRPPRGTLAPGAHDMAREHRVLSRLPDAYPRAPRALHLCTDEGVIGAPFVVLEHREGVVVRDVVPEELAAHPDVARRLDLALLDAAADLHTVDPEAVGLGELGRPDGFGDRQVRGWWDRWRRAATVDAPARMDEVGERLAASVPAPVRTSIVHNDLKLDNCQFRADDPDRVVSVFDWDMATLGDPLFDLGAMLVSMGATPAWVLERDEAVARYAASSGVDVAQIEWYLAFATWRTGVVLQQLHNRYMAGDSGDARLAGMGELVPAMADRAATLLGD